MFGVHLAAAIASLGVLYGAERTLARLIRLLAMKVRALGAALLTPPAVLPLLGRRILLYIPERDPPPGGLPPSNTAVLSAARPPSSEKASVPDGARTRTRVTATRDSDKETLCALFCVPYLPRSRQRC